MDIRLIVKIILIALIIVPVILLIRTLPLASKVQFINKKNVTIMIIYACLLAAYLVVHIFAGSSLGEIPPAEWAQVFLVVGLVAITGIYAFTTAKMAEEMKNARSPSITMQWMSANPNKREISAKIENEGFGPALNLKCYLTHKEVDFNHKFSGYTTFKVGQKHTLTLPSENFDFKAWNGLTINCDYESFLGEKIRSALVCESDENRSLEIFKLNSGAKE